MSRRRTGRLLVREFALIGLVAVGFYVLLVTGVLGEFARWFGEMMADRITFPSP